MTARRRSPGRPKASRDLAAPVVICCSPITLSSSPTVQSSSPIHREKDNENVTLNAHCSPDRWLRRDADPDPTHAFCARHGLGTVTISQRRRHPRGLASLSDSRIKTGIA
jgi:hypothetical protein